MVLSKLCGGVYPRRIPTSFRQVGFIYCSRAFNKSAPVLEKLRVAVIGQSTFAAEVYKLLVKDGHKVVGVFTVPDQGNREDPLGKALLLPLIA